MARSLVIGGTVKILLCRTERVIWSSQWWSSDQDF